MWIVKMFRENDFLNDFLMHIYYITFLLLSTLILEII